MIILLHVRVVFLMYTLLVCLIRRSCSQRGSSIEAFDSHCQSFSSISIWADSAQILSPFSLVSLMKLRDSDLE
jgi:hypothetical protein